MEDITFEKSSSGAYFKRKIVHVVLELSHPSALSSGSSYSFSSEGSKF